MCLPLKERPNNPLISFHSSIPSLSIHKNTTDCLMGQTGGFGRFWLACVWIKQLCPSPLQLVETPSNATHSSKRRIRLVQRQVSECIKLLDSHPYHKCSIHSHEGSFDILPNSLYVVSPCLKSCLLLHVWPEYTPWKYPLSLHVCLRGNSHLKVKRMWRSLIGKCLRQWARLNQLG